MQSGHCFMKPPDMLTYIKLIYLQKKVKESWNQKKKAEMQYYQKLADFFTPMLKAMASEYCNSIAYDSLQIHGGTGFMLDFPIMRIYRDARITSIYEGTTQLQVIAVIKGVTGGTYLSKIREYENEKIQPEYEFLRSKLILMTNTYAAMTETVMNVKDTEFLDFHALSSCGNCCQYYHGLSVAVRHKQRS